LNTIGIASSYNKIPNLHIWNAKKKEKNHFIKKGSKQVSNHFCREIQRYIIGAQDKLYQLGCKDRLASTDCLIFTALEVNQLNTEICHPRLLGLPEVLALWNEKNYKISSAYSGGASMKKAS
jgi:hypothetical protein